MKHGFLQRQLSWLVSHSPPPPHQPVWSRSPYCWPHGLCPAPAAWLILPQGCLSPPGGSSHTTFFSEASCSLSPTSSHTWTRVDISATLCMSGPCHRRLPWHLLVNLFHLTPQGTDALVPGSNLGSPAVTPADRFPSRLPPSPDAEAGFRSSTSSVSPASGSSSPWTHCLGGSTLTGATASCAARWFPSLRLQASSAVALLTACETFPKGLHMYPNLGTWIHHLPPVLPHLGYPCCPNSRCLLLPHPHVRWWPKAVCYFSGPWLSFAPPRPQLARMPTTSPSIWLQDRPAPRPPGRPQHLASPVSWHFSCLTQLSPSLEPHRAFLQSDLYVSLTVKAVHGRHLRHWKYFLKVF